MSKIMELAEIWCSKLSDAILHRRGGVEVAYNALETEVSRVEAEELKLHASLAESVLHAQAGWARYENSNNLVKGYQAELAALKAEKLEREKQEYAAYVNDDGFIVERDLSIAPGQKLYLAPGADSVPMTDDQIYELYSEPRSDAEMVAFARAVEAHHKIGVKP